MRMYDIIQKKRNGEELSKAEIDFFIEGYTNGTIADYQASALLMAIYFSGMNDREIADLTLAMAFSGDTVDLSQFDNLSADKHSTGGVGDKTSLIVAPIVASLGGKVTKMSGRGLGHTGGTVDKLESIDGYRTSLTNQEFIKQINEIGMAVIGQSGNLTPADKKLYALRDVTATVDSIPLITASIMSKKIAAGSKNIVLDVKVGSGAFMKTEDDAVNLAEKMVAIGKHCGRNMAAILTDMDSPLGFAIGNSLEIIEAVDVLKNNTDGDLKTVCIALAATMVSLIYDISYESAEIRVLETLSSGKAYETMKKWIAAQGGNIALIEDKALFKQPKFSFEVFSNSEGYITAMDTEKIGNVCVILGAGRASKEDSIDPSAGIVLSKKTGDYVKKNEPLCTLYTDNEACVIEAKELFYNAVTIGDIAPQKASLIKKIIR